MKKILLITSLITPATLLAQEITFKRQDYPHSQWHIIDAMRGEKSIGHASFNTTNKDACMLSTIEVDVPYRKQNIGSLLFNEIILNMKKSGCTSMRFTIIPFGDSPLSKEDTIKFYQKNGATLVDDPRTTRYPRMTKKID